MNKLKRRYIFDIVLSALLIVEMFFEVTGDTLHELLGCAFFVTIIAHLVLSRQWMAVTAGKISAGTKLKLANKLRVALAIGLAISFVALMASSIAISMLLIDVTGVNLAGAMRETWIIVHTVSAYALCAFTIAHVLVHWASIFTAFSISYNPTRRQAINAGASAIVVVSAIALGVAGNDAIDKILNPELPQRDGSGNDASVPNAEAAPADPSVNGNQPPQGGKGHFKGERRGEDRPNRNQPPTESPEGAKNNQAPSGNSSSGNSSPSQQDGSSTSGYCTLCHLHCPLSAPQCNKPYQAGLL